MSKVLSIGEILWDVFPDSEIIGGAPLNLATHLRALGNESYILSRVGCDRRGVAAAEQVRLKGIGTKFLQTDNQKPNGTAVVTFTRPGVAEYHIPQDVSHNFLTADDDIISAINAEGFDVMYFGTLAQKGQVSRNTIQRILNETTVRHKFFDVNLRMEFHDKDVLDFSFSKATIVKINDEEVAIVSKVLFDRVMADNEFAAAITERYHTEHLLVTLGADGCAVYSGDRHEHLTPPKVTVADTVGAGDAFSSGFIHSFLRGSDVFSAARFGNAMGSFVASKEGATPELDMVELERLGAEL